MSQAHQEGTEDGHRESLPTVVWGQGTREERQISQSPSKDDNYPQDLILIQEKSSQDNLSKRLTSPRDIPKSSILTVHYYTSRVQTL